MVCPVLRSYQCRLRASVARPSWTMRLSFWPKASLAAPPCFGVESVQLALWSKPFFLHDDERGEKIMTKGFLYRAVISILAIGEAIGPATAQFQWPPELSTPTEKAQPAPAIPKDKQAPKPSSSSVAGPAVAGNWRGELTQVRRQTPTKPGALLTPEGGEEENPDRKCT